MSFRNGDFILIDYIARVAETGETFDTTIEEVAKKEGINKEGALYEHALVAIGEGWVLKALDEKLLKLKLKQTEIIEIPPEKAFGKRDPDKNRLYPLRKLTSKGITPQIGMRVDIDGRLATVRTIGSGRVLLDFNPPLAGKTLAYEVTVKRRLTRKKDKITSLIHRRIPQTNIEKFNFNVVKNVLTVAIPEEALYIEGLQIAKRGIFLDIQKFFPKIKELIFTEKFIRHEPTQEKSSSKEDQ